MEQQSQAWTSSQTLVRLTDNVFHDVAERSVDLVGDFVLRFDGLGMQLPVDSGKGIVAFDEPRLALVSQFESDCKDDFSEQLEDCRRHKEHKHLS